MSYKYFPHTEEDIRQMVAKVGVDSLDDLYAEVPEEIRFKGCLLYTSDAADD